MPERILILVGLVLLFLSGIRSSDTVANPLLIDSAFQRTAPMVFAPCPLRNLPPVRERKA